MSATTIVCDLLGIRDYCVEVVGGSIGQVSLRGADAVVLPTRARLVLPGLALCLGVAALAYGVSLLLPLVSPLIVAIVAGIVATNTVGLSPTVSPGIQFSAKKLLRLGIVFLGLQLVLADILDLGAPMLLVVVAIVTVGVLGTIVIGRLLRIPAGLALLVACGFSICGAAAVAGAAGVIDPDDEAEQDTITAVALVVIFGTVMIPLVPIIADLLGMDSRTAGLWAGGSTHEIAQVVAVGGVIGGGALAVAVVTKLARVLLLAPVVAILSIRQRRLVQTSDAGVEAAVRRKPPPLVPAFVVGFIAMVLIRSFLPMPEAALTAGKIAQTGLLAAAMFGLGCGVKIASLRKVGLRPFALAGLSTLLVATVAYTGITLAT